MEQIAVNLPTASYTISIEKGLFQKVGELICQVTGSRKAVVVTDATVDRLYGEALVTNLLAAGFQIQKVSVEPGETSKSFTGLSQLYDCFLDAKLSRADLVIAFGGGVVGDLAGFAAATYLRGIPYVQIPTTLLAQIDSSVGGKVAVNLPQGKNLVGAFYQPTAVLIDPDLLDSLPERVLRDGMAEAIKYGAIADLELFNDLTECKSRQDFLDQAVRVIATCCRIKRDIVEEDEKDTGRRLILNFGHSIGHAVEQVFRYETYTHGEAVAIGMAIITERSEQLGLSKPGTAAKLRAALSGHGLPIRAVSYEQAALLNAMALDKKNTTSGLQLIIVPELGRAEIVTVSLAELVAFV
jgi:3-dehydroquinate synthase